jgi:hypothetical protein
MRSRFPDQQDPEWPGGDGDTFCATVRGLPDVVATGATLEACRDQFAEVVEEWDRLTRSR